MRARGASAAALVLFAGPLSHAQTAYQRYLTAAKRGVVETPVESFASTCIGGRVPRPQGFYSQGGWFHTDDLAAQLRGSGETDDATALVWSVGGQPRVVFQWTHDSEFDRNVTACLDATGKVLHSVSQYIPGTSEANQHWVYVHTLQWNARTGHYAAHGRFLDQHGSPRGMPNMSSEDKDFIAGERVYRRWSEFDFAPLLTR